MRGIVLKRPAHRRARTLRAAVFLALLLVLGMQLPAILAAPRAADAATPELTLTPSGSAQMLAGTSGTYTLAAANPGTVAVYNVAYQVVLPANVSYVAGSSSPASFGVPSIFANAPTAGETTLVWQNAVDVEPSSTESLSFGIQLNPSILVGSSFTMDEAVYGSSDPRTVPQFGSTGAVVPGSFDTTATSTSVVQVAAYVLTHSNDAPKGEELRGVHDDVTTYNLELQNNDVAATNGITLTAYLPADLEFLGCGGVDNTPAAFSGLEGAAGREYPGAPSLSATPAPAGTCTQPATVSTATLTAGQAGTGSPAGVYTVVTWTGIDLSTGQTQNFPYQAGITLFANTASFPDQPGTPPPNWDEANLDNNTGAVTTAPAAPGSLTSYSSASGGYTGTFAAGSGNPVVEQASTTVRSVDARILKTVAPNTFAQGGYNTWTLTVQTSEYRSASTLVVADDVPDGLCPVVSTSSASCAPDGGTAGTSSTGVDGTVSGSEGSYVVTFDLGSLVQNGTITLTLVTLGLPTYANGAPTLAGDSFMNVATLDGLTEPIFGAADPSPAPVSLDEEVETDAAGITTASPVLEKQISVPGTVGTAPDYCEGATYVHDTGTDLVYGAGDHVCFRLTVTFPSDASTRDAVLRDYLPLGSTFDNNATTVFSGSGNTLPAADVSLTTSAQQLTWTFGTSTSGNPPLYVQPGEVFDIVYSVLAGTPTTTADLTGNLAKFTSLNTTGQATSLRDLAGYTLATPVMTLSKGVYKVDGAPSGGNPPGTDGEQVVAGDTVTWRVDATNTGLVAATAVQVWDVLPSQITSCTSISNVSDGGSCVIANSAPTIEWTVGPVAPGASVGPLTYDMLVPAVVVAGDTLTNDAGIRSFQFVDNAGGANTYYPADNIDPTVTPTPGIPAADDTAFVTTPGAQLTKSLTTTVGAPNNDADQASIGDTVNYVVTATVPSGTSAYEMVVSDPVPTGLQLTAGSAVVAVSGGDGSITSTNFVITTAGGVVTATLSGTSSGGLTVPPASPPLVVTLSWSAVVENVAGNAAGTVIPNTAKLQYDNYDYSAGTGVGGPAMPALTAGADMSVVEPDPGITKSYTGPSVVSPGTVVPYTITASNASVASDPNASTLYGATVTDVVPAGLNVVLASISGGGTLTGNTITWTLGNLAPGQSVPLTYSASIAIGTPASSSFTNTATLSGTSIAGGGRSYSKQANVSVSTQKATIAKQLVTTIGAPNNDTDQASIGDTVTYTVTATLPADLSLPSAEITDTLPSGLTSIVPGTPTCIVAGDPGGPCPGFSPGTPAVSGQQVTWTLGSLTGTATAETITIVYTGVVANVAGNSATPTPTQLPNSAVLSWLSTTGTTLKTAPAVAPLSVAEPALSITKTHTGTGPFDGSSPIPFSITVANGTGANVSTAYNTTVVDPVPAGMTVVPASITAGGVLSGNTITWTLANLAPGGSDTLGYSATINDGTQPGQSFTNTATLTATSVAGAGARTYTKTASTTITASSPTISKVLHTTIGAPDNPLTQASIGDVITYTVTVTIPENLALASAAVSDQLPSGLVNVTAGTATCVVAAGPCPGFAPNFTGPAAPGDPAVWSLGSPDASGGVATVTLTYSAQVANVAGNSATPSPTHLVNSAKLTWGASSSAGPATATASVAEPALSITKTHTGTGPFDGSSPIPFSITVANGTGANVSTAYNTTVVDPVPAGMTVVPASITAGGVLSGNTITWTLANLAPGGSDTLGYSATINDGTQPGQSFTNTATLTATSVAGAGARTYTKTASTTITASSPTISKVLHTTIGAPDNPLTQASIGDVITYTVTVTIPENLALASAAVSDQLPSGLVNVTAGTATCVVAAGPCPGFAPNFTGPAAPGDPAVWSLGSPDASGGVATVTLTYSAQVANVAGNSATPSPTHLVNSAKLTWGASSSAGPATATASVAEPALSITKTHTGTGPFDGSSPIPFSITVANGTGANVSTAYNTTVVDPVPAGMTVVPASITAGGVLSGNTITWTLANLAPGGSDTLGYSATINDGTQPGQSFTNTATLTATSVAGAGARTYTKTASTTITASSPTISKVLHTTIGAPDNPLTQASIGDVITYTVTVTIPENLALASAAVSDQLPSGLVNVTAGTATCVVAAGPCPGFAPNFTGPAAPGDPAVWSLGSPDASGGVATVTLTYSAQVANVAGNSATPSPTHLVNSAKLTWGASSSAGPATATASVAEPALSITKTHTGTGPFDGSSPIPFSITVANGTGANVSTAYNTTVVDPLPSGMTATDISNGGTLSGGTITWNLASLAPGASVLLTYDGVLTSAPANGTLTNTASYSAGSVPGAGARTYSGEASTTILVGGPTLSKSLHTTVGAPDNPLSQASIGDTITYTVVATVPEGLSLPDGTVVDTLPSGLGSIAPVSASCTLAAGGNCPGFAPTFTGPSSPGGQLTWDLGTPVANGSVATITLVYSAAVIDTPSNTSSIPTALVNLAQLNWTGNSAVIDASATATVVEPDLSITKSHGGADIVPPGTPIPFQVTVANGTGPNVSTAYATVVTDVVPAGMTVDSSSISGGGVLSGSTITWNLSPLAPGASQVMTYSASINAAVAGGATYTNTATISASSVPGGTAAGGRDYSLSATSTVSQSITSLSLTKTLLGSSLVAGTNGIYVISVTDNGPQDAAGPITVTDDLPAGLTYVSYTSTGGFTCSASGQDVTCATADDVGLANGQTISLDLTVAVASDVTGSVLNSATATTPTPDASGNPATATGSATDPVGTVTSLSLTKTLVGALVAGSQGTYAISVGDTGPSDAAGPITVSDTLPSGLTFVSSSSADGFTCSADGQAVTCTTPDTVGLPNGNTISLDLVVAIAQDLTGANVTNSATATTPTLDLSGNPATATGSTTNPVTSVTSLSLTKSLVGELPAGGDATYSIVVGDTGPSDAAGPITVTDTLPAGLTYVSSSSADGFTCSADGQDVTCATAAEAGLPNGQTISLDLTVAVASNLTGPVTNSATATTPTLDSSGSPATASGSTTDPVTAVTSLSLTKTLVGELTAGKNATYTIAASDDGPADAAGPITVSDALPAGLSYVSASSSDGFTCSATGQDVTCATASDAGLPNGQTISLDLTVAVASKVTGLITNSATATTPTLDSSGNPATATGSATGVVTTVTSLSLKKTLVGLLTAGKSATYDIAISDHGPSDAAGPITVTDDLPAGLTYESASSPDGFTCSATGQLVTCVTPGDVGLPDGRTISLDLTVAVASDVTGSITNSATATTPTPDSSGKPATASGSTAKPVHTVARLVVHKTLLGAALVVGRHATYRIAVTDRGPSNAAGPIVVTDPLPTGLTFVSSASTDGFTCSSPGQTVTCTRTLPAGIPVGETVSLTLTVEVTPAVKSASLTNTATAKSATFGGSSIPARGSVTSRVAGGTVVPPAHTGEPWASPWWWLLTGAAAVTGLGLLWVPARRRRRRRALTA